MYSCPDPNKFHCANCPIRKRGTARPNSFFARIHRWHSAWWPGWKAFQTAVRSRRANATSSI